MQQYCDKSVSLMDEGEKSAILYYTHKSRIRDRFFDMECTVRISGWVEHDMIFQLTTFDVASSKTTVEIRQGESWKSAEPIAGIYTTFTSMEACIDIVTYIQDALRFSDQWSLRGC